MKIKFRFALFFVLIFSAFLLFGCTDDKSAAALQKGFEINSGEPIPPFFCAYVSDKTEFNINEVQLKLYYGTTKLDENAFDTEADYSVKILMENAEKSSLIFKEIDDFFTDKYKCNLIYNEANVISKIEFAYYEIVTIPKALFTQSKGFINFSIVEHISWTNGRQSEIGEGNGIYLYYLIKGENVILANKEFAE